MYRGQARLYDTIRPAGVRLPDPVGGPWRAYAHAVADDILNSADAVQRPRDFDIWAYWAEAIAQHYGPGSRYLDATRSLEVALWFALNAADSLEMQEVLGEPGPPSPNDVTVNSTCIKYRPNDQIGWLLVFDAPEAVVGHKEQHGEIVDLEKAPEIFAQSPRIQVQNAVLLASDASVNGGDLSNLLVCPPIPVGWPMTGADRLQALTEEMFPLPSVDDWYSRLLSVPVGYRLDASGRNLELAHTLQVPVYVPSSDKQFSEFAGRATRIAPDLVYSAIADAADRITKVDPESNGASVRVQDATRIVLEMPVAVMMPPTESPFWNHGLLCTDLDDSVDAVGLTGGRVSVPITNVFVQFSPMERVGWERLELPDYTTETLRAVWLVNALPHVVVTLFYQSFPDVGGFSAQLFYRFESSAERIERWNPDLREWHEAGSEVFDKWAFVTLAILRELSSRLKPYLSPLLATGGQGSDWKYVVGAGAATARLREVIEPRSALRCWVLRDIRDAGPFTGPRAEMGLRIESKDSWRDLNSGWLRQVVAQELSKA